MQEPWDPIPEGRRSPGSGHSHPHQYSCLESPLDRGAWSGYSPRGRKESDTAEQLTHSVALHLRSHLCQVATASGQGSVGLLGSGLVPCQAAGRGGSVWALRGAGFALHPRSTLFPRQTPTTNTQDCSQAPGAGTGTTANPWALPTSVPLPALPSALREPEVPTGFGSNGEGTRGRGPGLPRRLAALFFATRPAG